MQRVVKRGLIFSFTLKEGQLFALEEILYAADRAHEVCGLVRQVNGLGVLTAGDVL